MSDDRWLIVGLGNPGREYENTRHNVGFMAITAIAEACGITGKNEGKFNAMVGTGQFADHPVLLAQPLTFMNLSGQAVGSLMRYYKIPPERLLVIYDDAALPFGKIRVRPEGSSGGQKGVQSIIQTLGGNQTFARVRVGIGAPEGQKPLHAHVLSPFFPEEQEHLKALLFEITAACRMILTRGIEPAMNRYNGKALVSITPPSPPPPPAPQSGSEQ
jgi:PTH1 family peptidyl-tRNA hydrolase